MYRNKLTDDFDFSRKRKYKVAFKKFYFKNMSDPELSDQTDPDLKLSEKPDLDPDLYENPDPDPKWSENPDPDPNLSEKPDPEKFISDSQHCR